MEESFPKEKKTLREKEKLLVRSNFFFSHSVFKRLASQKRQKVSLCGNGLTLSQTSPGMCLQYKSFENTVGKGEVAHNEQFLLFPQCFLLFWKTFSLEKFKICCLGKELTLYHTIQTF